MNLDKIRQQVDYIDHEILKLLNERMELGLRTKKFKNALQDKDRETQILEQLKKYAHAYNLIKPDFVEKLFTAIMRESRKNQKPNKLKSPESNY